MARRVDDVIARLEAIPGVQAAGASNLIPLDGGGDVSRVESRALRPKPAASRGSSSPGVTGRYLDALGTPIVRGRTFTDAESQTRSAVAVVNVSMARRHFAPLDGAGVPPLAAGRLAGVGELGAIDPVGRRFRLLDDPSAGGSR